VGIGQKISRSKRRLWPEFLLQGPIVRLTSRRHSSRAYQEESFIRLLYAEEERLMRTTKKSVLPLALVLTLSIVAVGYAESDNVGGFFKNRGKGEDIWKLECAGAGPICATVSDAGPFFFDNAFGVTVKCVKPGPTTTATALAPDIEEAPDTSPPACVSNCETAELRFFCNPNGVCPLDCFCDEDYTGVAECVGRDIETLNFKRNN